MGKNIFIIILIAAGISVFYGVRYVKTPVNTEVAYITKCEESIRADALIIKNESVNTAENGGMVYAYVSDGDRVGKNRKIATVYGSSVNADVLKELNNTDKKIQNIKTNSLQSTNSNLPEESLVMSYVNNITEAVYDGNISEIYKIKSEIKDVRAGQKNSDNAELAELEGKKEELENKISGKKYDIYSKIAGVFINATDGLENIITPDNMLNMSIADFDSLISSTAKPSSSEISIGDDICKIVDNNRWYTALKTETDKLSNTKVGDSVTLRFDAAPSAEISAEVYAISEEENGSVILFIKCEKYINGILALRSSGVEVVLRNYTGYRLPIYAIRVQDNQTGVMVEETLSEVFKPCEVVYTDEDEEFVIIRSPEDSANEIKQNDKIIIGEK